MIQEQTQKKLECLKSASLKELFNTEHLDEMFKSAEFQMNEDPRLTHYKALLHNAKSLTKEFRLETSLRTIITDLESKIKNVEKMKSK